MDINYLAVKHLHMTSAVLSGVFFAVRAYWKMRDSLILERVWVKILPHLIDTILLASAITLVVMGSRSPLNEPWLMAKIIALVAYIYFGTLAIKRGRTAAKRALASLISIAIFAYILSVAVTKMRVYFLI